MDTLEPSTDAIETVALYERAFNSGDADAVNLLDTPDAVSTWEPDNPVAGAERAAEMVEFLQLRPRMTTVLKESYVTDDAALMVVDWIIETEDQKFHGTGVDVLRKIPDGTWRFAIDNPNRRLG
ncbi:nuclear transport factor 2 family protein [Frankia sp. QA3]|uniref:YybH family protein n=1 Tax=Frankia sp. QA3 TaxID=710111 RepID=UPI000269BF08|nr:nuclear transport factor 2 family protein [Frankia sp. QA3]EIV92724.1 hypothetical protein FraQA3DRAFT_2336 [Frankia sp. QA3]